MDIAFNGSGFTLSTKKHAFAFDVSNFEGDFVALSTPVLEAEKTTIKTLQIPGEYEINGALIHGIYSDGQANIVYKVSLIDTTYVALGQMNQAPEGAFYEVLGENVDVLLVNGDDKDFDTLKNTIEKIQPRKVIIGGSDLSKNQAQTKLNAKANDGNTIKVVRSQLPDDATEIVTL